MTEETISDLCVEAIRLEERVATYKMLARCAADELRIVDTKIIARSETE